MKRMAWINVAIGFWLVIAAFTQHSQTLTGVRMTIDILGGVAVLACSLWFLGTATSAGAAFWLYIFLGACLILAPFVFTYSPWNDVLSGAAVVVVALIAVSGVPRRTVAP